MAGPKHSAPLPSGELDATDMLALVLKEVRDLKKVVQEQSVQIDRLRKRIRDPLSETLSKQDVAGELDVHPKTVQGYAARWRDGDTSGLRSYYDQSGRWYTTRADLVAFQRANRSV